jgi:hypothetical protein
LRRYDDAGVQTPFLGQASLLLPSSSHLISGRIALLLDAAYDPDPLVAESNLLPSRPLLDLEGIYQLLRALLDTALDVAAPATFPRILGVPAWERIGPVVYLYSPRSMTA